MTPNFSDSLRRHIAEKSLTAAKFAEMVKVSKSFLSGVLAGKKAPSERFARSAAEALELGHDAADKLLLSAKLAAADPGLKAYVAHLEKIAGRSFPEAYTAFGPQFAAFPVQAANVDRKFAAKKTAAIDLLRSLMDAAWCGGSVHRAGWKDIAKLGEIVEFKSAEEKVPYVIFQVSYVIRRGDSVEVVERRSADPKQNEPRITEGASLLLSFTPDPCKGLREQLDAHIRSTVCPEDRRQRALHWTVAPLGVILNSVNVRARDPDETKPPAARPAYVMLACEVLVDRPVSIFRLSGDSRADDRQAQSRRIRDLRFADFDGFADRAVIHRLRHPDSPLPSVANGSAVLALYGRARGLNDPAWETDRVSSARRPARKGNR